MTKIMLIDAAHPEETRVVVADGTRIEELDFEHQSRKQLRGNIYLAKVTRVEPSLQAAFIEYGGNRHGFLAFNEIHPDYYQIPVADREALLREMDSDDHDDEESDPEDAGEDASDDEGERAFQRRQRRLMRRYKIQEVIRRRQIMLVQVVKEERGNKGAALTTYLSLAGRYGVLMPNTARGGGISRKITSATDRRRLKGAVQGLEVPTGMGLIVRTAGAKRTRAEIRRDYDYLLRLWENIREKTLKSIAPSLIYEEEDLVKRAIRDMYDKDLDGIWVEGEAGYREARDFMRMIMPSQAAKIRPHREATPLFVAHRIEDQLAQIHSPVVPLRSGGYLVINQTEALVAVDVNSGRATRERNIEATALKTNLEAAEETARQLRLRDLAGLIVIDFIDMDEGKNNRAVEKVLKDALASDRARVQMGRISGFGLMEISRQRRRMGVLEGATHVCEHCQGMGRVRSVESSALAALRAIEVEAAKGGAGMANVRLAAATALYVLNEKRAYLARIEHLHGLEVTILVDDALAAAEVQIDRTAAFDGSEGEEGAAPRSRRIPIPLAPEPAYDDEPAFEPVFEDDEEDEDENEDAVVSAEPEAADEAQDRDERGARDERGRRRRGRHRRGGARDDEPRDREAEMPSEARSPDGGDADTAPPEASEDDEDGRHRRRRRGRRGGRRMREEGAAPADVYAWVHPHGGRDSALPSEDPYAWRDPHGSDARQEDRAMEARAEKVVAATEAEGPTSPIGGPQTRVDGDPYAWGDAADGEARRGRGRNRRSRGGRGRSRDRGRDDAAPATDAQDGGGDIAEQAAPDADETQAPVIDPGATEAPDAADPTPPATSQAPVEAEVAEAEPAEAPAAEPEAEAAPPAPEPAPAAEPAPPPEPDPNEISGAPPAAPRRGWWRR